MTEEDRHLLLDVKAMLTGKAWGNDHSVAPLLGNSTQWWYGRLVPMERRPYVISQIAAGVGIYEKWEQVFELMCFDLSEDKILVYVHSNYSGSKYEIKLDMLIKWACSSNGLRIITKLDWKKNYE
jgi:hypothetical protein